MDHVVGITVTPVEIEFTPPYIHRTTQLIRRLKRRDPVLVDVERRGEAGDVGMIARGGKCRVGVGALDECYPPSICSLPQITILNRGEPNSEIEIECLTRIE